MFSFPILLINRRLSLKFLAWYLLNENVQVDTHDSIEDARTALLLYQKYLELKQAGTLQETLRDIYDKGNSLGFRPPQARLPPPPPPSEEDGIPTNCPCRRYLGVSLVMFPLLSIRGICGRGGVLFVRLR